MVLVPRLSRRPGRRRAAGFTLTELAIVLGVIGLVLAGIWTAAAAVYDARKATQTVQDITTIVGNMRYLYGTRGSFPQGGGTQITPAMMAANIFPSDLLGQLTNGNPTNVWNGEVRIYVLSATLFRLSFYNTPPKACLAIASQLLGNTANTSLPVTFTTSSGSSSVSTAGGPPNSVTLSSMCGANGGSAPSTEFDYTIR